MSEERKDSVKIKVLSSQLNEGKECSGLMKVDTLIEDNISY